MRNFRRPASRGMTANELLLSVGGILAFMALFIYLIAAAEKVKDARNARRWTEVNAILNGILLKEFDDQTAYVGRATAPILEHPVYVQVIVSDAGDVDCAEVGKRPKCPGQPLDANPGRRCVADLADLVPNYLPHIGLDPFGVGYQPDEDYLGLGENNTGYYVHRLPGGRLEVGSCFSDRDAQIRLAR
jgi:hypothetical protein